MDRYSKFRKLYNRAKEHALREGFEFNLTIDQLYRKWNRQAGQCKLTGIDLYLGDRYEQDHGGNSASLDRIDSTKGYTVRNVQWVHKNINSLKSNWGQKEFIKLCKFVSYQFDRKYSA